VTAGKKKKALGANNTSNTSVSAPEGPSGAYGEAQTSSDPLQLQVNKRRAEELCSLDCSPEPARRRPAPRHLWIRGPGHHGRNIFPEQAATRTNRG
jgi:hypothetical protein